MHICARTHTKVLVKPSGQAGLAAPLRCDGNITPQCDGGRRKFVVSLKLGQTSTRLESIRLLKLPVRIR